VVYTVPELNQARFTPFYLQVPSDCWADYLAICCAWSTRQIYQHCCWYKRVLSIHRVFQCWLDLLVRWVAQFPAQGFQRMADLLARCIGMLQRLADVLCG